MKRFFYLQLFLLTLGVGWLAYVFFNNVSLIIPVDFLCRLLKFPLRASKAVLSRQNFTLYDVKGKFSETPFEASCVCFSLLNGEAPFDRWQCEIKNGTLGTVFGTLTALNGLVQKNGDDYHGILSAHHQTFGSLLGFCRSFRALQQYKPLLEKLKTPVLNGNGQSFLFENLQVHAGGSSQQLSAMYQASECTFGNLRATSVFGQTYFDEKAAHISLQGQRIDTPKFSVYQPLVDGTYAFKSDRFPVKFQGNTDVLRYPLHFCGHSENFQPNADNDIQLSVNGEDIDGQWQFLFHLPKKQWSLSKGLLVANPNVCNRVADVPHNPYQISFNTPLIVYANGNLQRASVQLSSSDFTVNEQPFKKADVTISKETEQMFSWDARFQDFVSDFEENKAALRTHGTCDFSKQKGQMFCIGSIVPDLVNALDKHLPVWWHTFSDNFRFFDKNPYADLAFQWDAKHQIHRLVGYAEAKAGRYKHTDFKKFAVTFFHQPGCAKIKLHRLKTTDGDGSCCICWPYDPQDKHHEQFDFKGSGTFSVQHWETLIGDFIGVSDWSYLDHLHPSMPTEASFKGCVSLPSTSDDFLEVTVHAPTHQIDALPVKDLEVMYRQSAEKTQSSIHGLLFHAAPFDVQLNLFKETFELNAEGKQLPLGSLLQQPIFSEWVADIPSDNLKTYDGLLDVTVKATGRHQPEFSVTGEGFVDFKNPNLSQIHLLGPLQRLIFSKIPFFPTINFNRFVSEFSFNEHEIRSQKAELTGTTSQADIKGVLDLKNHWLKGDLNFSFLDSQQVGIPIVGHAFQILTPVTRAFSASVNGSFKDPKYFITFNPIRWALPKGARPKKKP